MTRGKVKSKLISERKWVIRSQAPYYFFFIKKSPSAPSYPYIFLFYVINIKRKRDGGKGKKAMKGVQFID